MDILEPSLNKSNKFQSIYLNDPINISINNTLYSKSTTKEIPIRFSSKERIPKEREYIGSYKIPGEYLKKRTNPTEELIKQKEEELRKKKELLELYENTGERFIAKTYTKKTDLNKNGQEFTIHEMSDLKDYENKKEENGEITVKEDLIKVIDSQVNLLKRMSQDQINELSKSGDINYLKNKKLFLQNGAFGLNEKDVDTQFLAINDNRIQTLKHVQTRHKPEYMSLEEFEKEKLEQEKELKDIEDEYYGRKKPTEEELRRQRELKMKMIRQRQLNQMIQRPGYNNDNPLEEKDILYINKYGNYLQNKKDEYNKLGYEEEWNNTRLKSLNANGVVIAMEPIVPIKLSATVPTFFSFGASCALLYVLIIDEHNKTPKPDLSFTKLDIDSVGTVIDFCASLPAIVSARLPLTTLNLINESPR